GRGWGWGYRRRLTSPLTPLRSRRGEQTRERERETVNRDWLTLALMKPTLLKYLQCPECGGALSLFTKQQDGAEIIEGELICRDGAHRFPILRGVPRFARLDQLAADKAD